MAAKKTNARKNAGKGASAKKTSGRKGGSKAANARKVAAKMATPAAPLPNIAATDLPDPGFFEVMDLAMDVRGTEADRENEAVERAVRHFRENVRA